MEDKKKTQKKETPKESTFFQDIQNLYMSADRLTKDTEGYNYKYVQLKDVLSEAKKLCLANNFIFIQTPKVKRSKDDFHGEHSKLVGILETQLIHKSGEKKTAQTLLPTKDNNDPQRYGAAITYMRRYSLTAILGLEETDDDAAEASKEPTKSTKPAKKLTNVERMKQILYKGGAKTDIDALKAINGCGAFSSEIKELSDMTEAGALRVITELTKDDDED